MAGLNDMAASTGTIPHENALWNIAWVVKLAVANRINVVLCSVLPAYDFSWRPGLEPAEKVAKLNRMLESYAIKNKIVYVDYYSVMVDDRKGLDKKYTNDGVHPTLAGYKVMEPLAEKAIQTALKRSK